MTESLTLRMGMMTATASLTTSTTMMIMTAFLLRGLRGRTPHFLLWLWLRLHLGFDHPDLLLRCLAHLRPRVRGDLLQGEAGGGGRGGGDRRGVDQDPKIYNLAPQVISMSPFQAPTISRRCRIPIFVQLLYNEIENIQRVAA